MKERYGNTPDALSEIYMHMDEATVELGHVFNMLETLSKVDENVYAGPPLLGSIVGAKLPGASPDKTLWEHLRESICQAREKMEQYNYERLLEQMSAKPFIRDGMELIYVLDDGETWQHSEPEPVWVSKAQLERIEGGENVYSVVEVTS